MEGLLAHAEDAGDHNFPLMYWYAAEHSVAPGRPRLDLASRSKIPLILSFMGDALAQRVHPTTWQCSSGPSIKPSEQNCRGSPSCAALSESLKGKREVPMPRGWSAATASLTTSQDREVASLSQPACNHLWRPQALTGPGIMLASPQANLARQDGAGVSCERQGQRTGRPFSSSSCPTPRCGAPPYAAWRHLMIRPRPRDPCRIPHAQQCRKARCPGDLRGAVSLTPGSCSTRLPPRRLLPPSSRPT